MNNALKPHHITHVQFALLAQVAWLTRSNQVITQVTLSKQTKTSLAVTSQVLRILERKGLICRQEHPTDTRAKAVSITPVGTETVKQGLAVIFESDDKFFGLKPSEKKEFVRLLSIISSH